MGEATTVKKCTCIHAYQDKRYGKFLRVHNKGTKGWVCTVCRNVVLSK